MGYPGLQRAARQYRDLRVETEVENASPHRLIQLLLEGAIIRVARAKGCMERKEVAGKGENIGKVIAIVDTLRASLDMEQGGEVAGNLSGLYEYMGERLLRANVDNDPAILDQISSLLTTVKAAWDGIAAQVDEKQKVPVRDLGAVRGHV